MIYRTLTMGAVLGLMAPAALTAEQPVCGADLDAAVDLAREEERLQQRTLRAVNDHITSLELADQDGDRRSGTSSAYFDYEEEGLQEAQARYAAAREKHSALKKRQAACAAP